MKTSRREAHIQKAISLINQMNEEQLTDFDTVVTYMLTLSKPEFKKFKALSEAEGFSVKEFAKSLRAREDLLLQEVV